MGGDAKAVTDSAHLASLEALSGKLPSRLTEVFFGLHGSMGSADGSHTDAATMASLPLWPALHYATRHDSAESDASRVQLLAAMSALLPRTSDGRLYVQDPNAASARLSVHTPAPTSESAGGAPSKAPDGKDSEPSQRYLRAVSYFSQPKLVEVAISGNETEFRQASASVRVAVERGNVSENKSQQDRIAFETTGSAPLSIAVLQATCGKAFILANARGARDVIEELTAAISGNASLKAHLGHIPSAIALLSSTASSAARTAGTVATVDKRAASALRAKGFGGHHAGSDAFGRVARDFSAKRRAAAASVSADVEESREEEEEEEEDDSSLPVPQTEGVNRVQQAIMAVGGEVDFDGQSGHCRDLDQLTRFLRDVMLAPAGTSGAPISQQQLRSLCFDRRRGHQTGSKRKRDAPESRMFLPTVSSMSDMFGGGDDKPQDLVALERLVTSPDW